MDLILTNDLTNDLNNTGSRSLELEQEANIFSASLSSETPVVMLTKSNKRYFEILKHGVDNVDFSRAIDNSLPLLICHNTEELQVGICENLRLEEGKLKATLRFGSSDEAESIRRDVASGILKGLSIGYMRDDSSIIWNRGQGEPDTAIVNRWTPYECSILPVPADVNCGINRASQEIINNDFVSNAEIIISEQISESGNRSGTFVENSIILKEKNQMDKNQTVTLPAQFNGSDSPIKNYSISAHIRGLMEGKLAGAELEVSQELGRTDVIPTAAFSRAWNMTTAGAEFANPVTGSYLDLLLPGSALGKLGVSTIALSQPTNLPAADTPAPATVSEVDGSGASIGTATTREVVLFPKIAVAQMVMSKASFQYSAPGTDAYLKQTMLRKHQADMEAKAILSLITQITLSTSVTDHDITGNETQLQDLANQVKSVIDERPDMAYLVNHAFYSKLQGLKRVATLDRAVAQDGKIWDMPAVVSALVVRNTYDPVLFGAWSNCLLASFGNGVEVAIDSTSAPVALKNQVVLTAAAHWDCKVTDLSAFSKIVDTL